MCGIAGFGSLIESGDGREVLHRLADALVHRGPDDFGAWTDAGNGVGLGHRRLSLIDLSSHGHRPMVSHCGRYRIVLSGEIYDHVELHKSLRRQRWRSQSDTETVLACFRRFGVSSPR